MTDLAIFHVPAPLDPEQPPPFDTAAFVASLGQIRRTTDGGALVVLKIEPDYVYAALKLWGAPPIVSVNVSRWEPFEDDDDD